MGEHIHKRHNKSLLLYHLVCPIKYRRSVLKEDVGESLVLVCKEIEFRYDIFFIEIGLGRSCAFFSSERTDDFPKNRWYRP